MSRAAAADPYQKRCPRPGCPTQSLLSAMPDSPAQCPGCQAWFVPDRDGDWRQLDDDEIGNFKPAATPAPSTKPARVKPRIERPKTEKPVGKRSEDRELWLAAIDALVAENGGMWPSTTALADRWDLADNSGTRNRLVRLEAEGLVERRQEGAGRTSMTRWARTGTKWPDEAATPAQAAQAPRKPAAPKPAAAPQAQPARPPINHTERSPLADEIKALDALKAVTPESRRLIAQLVLAIGFPA